MIEHRDKEVRIKLALLIERTVLPVWQYQMIENLLSVEHVQIVLVLCEHSGQKKSFVKRVFSGGLSLVALLEKKVFGWEGDARQYADISPLLENSSAPDVIISFMSGQQHFERSEADLLVDLRSGVHQPHYPDYCYASSTQQVWRHFYDGTGSAELLRAGVSEFCTGASVLHSGILSEGNEGDHTCLLSSRSGVNRPMFTQNVDQMLWKMSDFIPFLLRENSDIEALSLLRENRSDDRRSLKLPTRLCTSGGANKHAAYAVFNVAAIRFYCPALFRLLRRSLSQFGVKLAGYLPWNRVQEQWILLLGRKTALTSDNDVDIQVISDFKKIIPPADRFWADPFLVSRGGRDYVFFEELIYSEGKGTLACLALNDGGVSGEGAQPQQPVVILEKPYHLSYPFTFDYQGQLYMMPESAENKTLDIYRCEQFPHQWVWVKTLMNDIEAYDATLYEDQQGIWWLFVCMRHHEYASTNELLYLFSASSPLSDDWVSHPCNPIVTDAATARPAGHLLRLDGKLYRPSQNCAGSYGRGLNLNEVMVLNHQEYREQTSSRIIPAGCSELDGVHTLNCLNDRVVSDGIFLRK